MTPDGTSPRFDYQTFVAKYPGATVTRHGDEETVYAQGDPANAVFYIIIGTVKVTVLSSQGKEAVLALLRNGDFFGEECLHQRQQRNATVITTTVCEIARLDRDTIARALGDDHDFAAIFLSYVLEQNERLHEGLINQLFNSSEKRLARILLTLANAELEDHASEITIPITQETLAQMVGTTRARINRFMMKFRERGYIDYNGMIRVHDSLHNVLRKESPNVGNDRSPRR